MNHNGLLFSCRALCVMLMILFLNSGCEHRPLEIMSMADNLFVRVYFNENIRNVSFGFYDETKKKPEYYSPLMMRVVFCDEASGKVVAERYLSDCGKDEQGYYIQGPMSVPQGRYDMMAYNFDTRYTKIKGDNLYSSMTAYTKLLSEPEVKKLFTSRGVLSVSEKINRQPDHLFVAKVEGVNVSLPDSKEPDTLKVENSQFPVAETVVKTYYMQINVKGVEYVRSAVALVSGMSGSKTLHDGEMIKDDVTSIFFGLNNGVEKYRANNETSAPTVAYATFNTFGKLPHEEGYLDITFEFNTIDNKVQIETFRITDIWDTPQVKDNQWIIIDKVIEIIPPDDVDVGGGMRPGVDDWDVIEGIITI